MSRDSVLFICVHNSGRSQMAEAYLTQLAGDRFKAMSAGFEPAPLNPLVVEVMQEDGLDISRAEVDSVFDFYKRGLLFHHVVTVCDDGREQQCPIFPGPAVREHWPLPDPSAISGTDHDERLAQVRLIRDQVRARVTDWLERQG